MHAVSTLLVFGARNLGRAIAAYLAEQGWNVAAAARSQESVTRVEKEVPGAVGIVADASREDDVTRAFEQTRSRLGAVDLIVVAISPDGSTGRAFGGGALGDASAETLTPYTGDLLPNLYRILRIGARVLTEQGSGTYIQITGGSARRGMSGRGAWAAAAFATRALIQSAASELREQGVHVALLIVDAVIENEKSAERLTGKPTTQSAGEDDIARAVAYLASQSPRAWTHELQITPSGDRWVP